MRTALILLAILAAPAFAAQTVWKWVDAQGVTHYSDRPMPGATRMELNVGSAPEAQSSPPSLGGAQQQSAAPDEPAYRELEIWKPAQGDTLANTGGLVEVNLRLEPALRPGHNLALYLDGRLVEDAAPNATEFSLSEVARGEHSLLAVITDRRGQRVQQSEPVTFVVRQSSVANPPVGPALRPPPKPTPRGTSNKMPRTQPTYAALNGAHTRVDPATNKPAVTTKPKPNKP